MAESTVQETVVRYLAIARRRRWWVLIPFAAVVAVATPVILTLPPTYRSTTLITVEAQKVPEAFVRTTVTTPIEDRLQAISQQILSRTRLERVIEKFNLYRPDANSSPSWRDQVASWFGRRREEPALDDHAVLLSSVDRMRQNIDIQVPRGRDRSSTISISYSGRDPQTVRDVTNELASLFIEENLRVREAQAEGTTEFLEHELEAVKSRLEVQEQSIRSFKERSMGELPEQLDANLRTLDRLQMEQQGLQQSLKNAEDRYVDLNRQLTAAGLSTPGGTMAGDLEVKLQTLRVRLAELRTEYRDEYPDIILLKREIEATEAELASAATTEEPPDAASPLVANHPLANQVADQRREINSIRRRQQSVADQIRDYEKRVENTPFREQQLAMLLRDYENVQRTYETLLEKRQEARIAESLERRQKAEIFRILDPALLPRSPSAPNRPFLLMAALGAGLAAGLGLALGREQMDPSIQSEEDLARATTGLPLLAVIPLVTDGRHGLRQKGHAG